MDSDDYFPVQLLHVTFSDLMTDFAAAFGIAILLLLFVTFLSAAENAITALSQENINKLEESSSARDKIILYLSDHLRLMKASCCMFQSFILIAVTALCAYGMNIFGIAPHTACLIAFLCTIILWILFYGIIPKSFSNHKLGTARATALLLKSVINICSPFVRMTSIPVEKSESEHTKKTQVPLAGEAPNDMHEEKEMLEDIIHFYNKKANEIMTPRTDIVAIYIKSDINEVVNAIVESGYSRIPVYEEDEDDIRGVLYVKDIIPALGKSGDFEWQSLMRKPYFVPETKKIDDLLDELRAHKTHIAIVVDEFGCTSGLVTMEDIVEEIVGDISDEYDEDEHYFMALPDGSYIFEGKTQLNDFFRETGVPPADFSEHTEEAETLTGLMLAIKGTLPHRREIINYKRYRFRILEADERRVLKVKFSMIPYNKEDKK
ncbi:MAG: CBS domain-containing protein [Tannerella sp.]|nr:CBS domain-containing protein [Tannerella sp.]